jgi:hypothetical protein
VKIKLDERNELELELTVESLRKELNKLLNIRSSVKINKKESSAVTIQATRGISTTDALAASISTVNKKNLSLI